MRARINELFEEYCKPKPTVTFNVIDSHVEQLPTEPDDSIDIHIYFVT